ncbi:uncharacterized protein LOC105187563 [Harpegnathos saltator]|uniref:uncharacterized protein LOC105187563 n=1 Tax=Harpegnathos saltator TaxID=610380 RepID=UPI000DBED876|nr:uncharacterized protein LOC105187563 [Harpegnathos saltator]
MDPFKLRVYTERFEKENRLISVREVFVPSLRTKPLTGKFYAKHDVLSPADVKQNDVDLVKREMEKTPKDVYSFRPPAANMEYAPLRETSKCK